MHPFIRETLTPSTSSQKIISPKTHHGKAEKVKKIKG